MGLFDILFGQGNGQQEVQDALSNGAVIVDVRTPEEFRGGSVKGSINIPLEKLEANAGKLKKMKKVIVLCCASGMRSRTACSILRSKNIKCHNGGSWSRLM